MTTPARRSNTRKPCEREGCGRLTRSGKTYRHCSLICAELDIELARTRQICQAIGSTPLSTELWVNLVEVSDAWSEFRQARGQLFREIKIRDLPVPTASRRVPQPVSEPVSTFVDLRSGHVRNRTNEKNHRNEPAIALANL